MIPMVKCYGDDFEGKDNVFEVMPSKDIENWECRIYDDIYQVKGILRISQSLTLRYEAPLDLVLFFDVPSALKW